MTKLAEIQEAILALKLEEQQALRAWLQEIEETPEMLAAIDEGIRSLERSGGKLQTRAELQEKVRRWATGASHQANRPKLTCRRRSSSSPTQAYPQLRGSGRS